MIEQNKNFYFLKGILIIQTLGLLSYTLLTVKNDGINFFEKAWEFPMTLTWMGQFSLDFSCYLILSALWILWRNRYTSSSIVLAVSAAILGIIVFAPYVLYLLYTEKGNLEKVLIGEKR